VIEQTGEARFHHRHQDSRSTPSRLSVTIEKMVETVVGQLKDDNAVPEDQRDFTAQSTNSRLARERSAARHNERN
jgi:hypothetical protein